MHLKILLKAIHAKIPTFRGNCKDSSKMTRHQLLLRIMCFVFLLFMLLILEVEGTYDSYLIQLGNPHCLSSSTPSKYSETYKKMCGDNVKLIETFKNQQASHRRELGRVSNFPEILKPFLYQHCHISFTNFYGVDLSEFQLPILLRHPALGWLWKLKGQLIQPDPLWFTVEIIRKFENLSEETHEYIYQNRGSLWAVPDFQTYRSIHKNVEADQFFRLDLQHYLLNTRPWNCEISIEMFPPTFYFGHAGRSALPTQFPRVFYHNPTYACRLNAAPSNINPVTMIVAHHGIQTIGDAVVMDVITSKTSERTSTSIRTDIFLLLSTKVCWQPHHIHCKELLTSGLYQFQICHSYNCKGKIIFSTKKTELTDLSHRKSLSTVMCNQNPELNFLDVRYEDNKPSVTSNAHYMLLHILTCEGNRQLLPIHALNLKYHPLATA